MPRNKLFSEIPQPSSAPIEVSPLATAVNYVATLTYDGEGNRVAKLAPGVTTQYLIDDLNPTGLPQVVEEIVNGMVQRTYAYGLNRISQNQLVNNTWQPSFYGYDGAASVRLLTDASGTVTDTYDYDAFGNLINSTGGTPNNYLYRGEQFDPDLGLYYLRARYFNPLTGRFLTRDPEAGDPTDPATLHKYLYARHDPVNWDDPTGRQAATEEVLVIRNIPLSAAVIGGLELVAQAITCLYDFDASAVKETLEHGSELGFTLRRFLCGAQGTGQQPVPQPAPPAGIVPTAPNPSSQNCSDATHEFLQKQVNALCKGPDRARNAQSDSCEVLRRKLNGRIMCQAARDKINNTCFNGGDPGHQEQSSNEANGIANCQRYLAQKGCN